MAKSIVIELRRQVLITYEGGSRKYHFSCATGDDKHPTPIGRWRVLHKHRYYASHHYAVPMNYAIFFTATGEAIHESHLVGLTSFGKYFGLDSLGSHGCVRLSHPHARLLFDWTPLSTPAE